MTPSCGVALRKVLGPFSKFMYVLMCRKSCCEGPSFCDFGSGREAQSRSASSLNDEIRISNQISGITVRWKFRLLDERRAHRLYVQSPTSDTSRLLWESLSLQTVYLLMPKWDAAILHQTNPPTSHI